MLTFRLESCRILLKIWELIRLLCLCPCSSHHSPLIWWRLKLTSTSMQTWCGARRSTRTRVTTTTSSPASPPALATPAPSGELAGKLLCTVSVSAAVWVLVCVFQVRWSWVRCSSSYWKQTHTPAGATAFPRHGVWPGGILRKTVDVWHSAGRTNPPALTSPFTFALICPHQVDISDLLHTGVTHKSRQRQSRSPRKTSRSQRWTLLCKGNECVHLKRNSF